MTNPDITRMRRSALMAVVSRDRRRLAAMFGFILFLHLLGFGLMLLVARGGPVNAAHGFGVGVGLTAYVLGMRHAFDADHIVAIDNTTRKLLGEGRRPVSVGFWFSLGHSTVVLLLCLALGLGVRAIAGGVVDESSSLHQATGIWGSLVSGLFLLLIGILNARAFAGIFKVARRARNGDYDSDELDHQLRSRGFLARILGKLTKSVRKEWHMHPIGLLFGLGFDTATEISLLILSSSAAAFDLPWYAYLALPFLFAAGMSLLDTIDGTVMMAAYEWALLSPARRIYYNLVITGISVATALIVGGVGLGRLLGEQLGVTSGPLAWAGQIDFEYVGYGIVALFLTTWIVSAAVWRFGRIEERLQPRHVTSKPARAVAGS
ncbi:HoxN/HupN/NixA family nickel/cobalt transporter [Amycolatopsis sp. CA-128772]|uniref:HoxN/HupN/NixA family nickel/cobalt transporter n=1 Tax=Amycolatopsis sp. CA-128772 TaxID=2073159 RepID=UPI001E3052CC|nr:HoxN/HupN/NixA family nickel/cobalt transporter [Amycolatopsis sp. CA-128772]